LLVQRRDGQIAFLVANLEPLVGELVGIASPYAFLGIDTIVGFVRGGFVTDVIKYKKLCFRTEIGGISQTGAFKLILRQAGDPTWGSVIRFAGDRVFDIADKA
jgi:hypothetical protein